MTDQPTPDYTTPPLKIVGSGKVVIGQAAEQVSETTDFAKLKAEVEAMPVPLKNPLAEARACLCAIRWVAPDLATARRMADWGIEEANEALGYESSPAPAGELPTSDVTCPECNGIGKIESDSSLNVRSRRCRRCEGTGSIHTAPSAEQGEGNGWRTIDSAPKDGTEIILGWAGGPVVVAYWMSCPEENYWRETGWFASDDDVMCNHALTSPTLWQPLPAAPAEGG